MAKSYAPSAEIAASDYQDRRISYNANVNLETEKSQYDSKKSMLSGIPDKYAGYYTYQNEYKSEYNNIEYRSFSITIKVPVKSYNEVIEEIKKVADVKSLNVYASDMTNEFTDAKAYLDSYKKEKDKIEALLDKATTVEDIIKIEDKLTDLQQKIDNYQQQITNIERQTDYAQISVSLEEKRPISETFYQWTGIREHLRNIVSGFDNILVLISSWLAWIIVIGLGWIVYSAVKRKFF